MTSLSAAQIYARQLLLKKHGYPLWVPEPIGHSDTYRTKGVRIGDVGYVTQDGGFETLFNVRAGPDVPINLRGVPQGFEQVDLTPSEITYIQDFHPPLGVPIISAEGKRQGVDVGLAVESSLPVVLDTSAQFNWASSEGAILHLPDGAGRIYAPPGRFKDVARRGARSWYEFANTTLAREVPNGSLCLVTGCDKTRRWMVGSFSGASSHNQVALRIGAAFIAEGRIGFNYAWDGYRSCDYRAGPSTPRSTTARPPDFTELIELDSAFDSDAPDMQNQTVFVRGYRILLRMPTFLSIGRSSVKVDIHSIDDGGTNTSIWQNNRPAPFSGTQGSSTSSPWWSGKSRAYAEGPESELKDEMDVELEPFPDYQTETVDFAQILNSVILQSTPSADVSLIHDDEWAALLPYLGESIEIDSAEAQMENAGVRIVVSDGCASLDLSSLETSTAVNEVFPQPSTQSMPASSSSRVEPIAPPSADSTYEEKGIFSERSSDLMTSMTTPNVTIPNILVFGGAEKTYILDMFDKHPEGGSGEASAAASGKAALVASQAGGLMFDAKASLRTIDGILYRVYDTVGVSRGTSGRVATQKAFEQLHKLIDDLQENGGVNLLVYVIGMQPINSAVQANYDLLFHYLCRGVVPIVAIVVGAELEGHKVVVDWWQESERDLMRRGMRFAEVVLVANAGKEWREWRHFVSQLRRSTGAVATVIKKHCMPIGWEMQQSQWHNSMALSSDHVFAKTFAKIFNVQPYLVAEVSRSELEKHGQEKHGQEARGSSTRIDPLHSKQS